MYENVEELSYILAVARAPIYEKTLFDLIFLK